MINTKKLSSLIAILLTISMIFTACGGNGSKAETSSSHETSSVQQEESTEAPQESSLDKQESSEHPAESTTSDESEQPEADNNVQTVEITMDNWQEYLEIVPMENMAAALMGGAIADPATTDFFEYELVLKEEYVKGYLEHANYTLPDLNGQSLGVPAIRSYIDAGAISIDKFADISFTYTVEYPDPISDQSPTIESGTENNCKLNDSAFARYLLALSGALGEFNDSFKVYGMPLIGIVIGKDQDISSLAESGKGIDVLTNNVKVEIKSISGTLHIWTEE